MKKSILLAIGLFACWGLRSQVTCSATGDSGSGYPAFQNAGFGIENPDCEHTSFGAHITQVYDEDLGKNVFLFHSHIDDDNDRCIVFDRVRMEVKGGPGTDEELIHPLGSESFYRWKFYVHPDYVSSSSFHHIFQLKAKEGDDGLPVLTFTLRTSTLELRHAGGDSGVSLGVLTNADLGLFKGQWVEAFVHIVHGENGQLEASLRNLFTGEELLNYSSDDIDLWRLGASYNRPKWGMYRKKVETLEDEAFRFADFCISETAASLCPADDSYLGTTIAENERAGAAIKIYPNPVRDRLFIESPEGGLLSVRLLNLMGELILEKHQPNGSGIDIGALASGLYLLAVEAGEGQVFYQKIIIEK